MVRSRTSARRLPAAILVVLIAFACTVTAHAATLSSAHFHIYQLEPENPFVGGLVMPRGVAASPDGEALYVADSGRGFVLEMTSYGSFVRALGDSGGPGQLHEPTGIATDSAGNVYVADQGSGRVVKYTASGAFLSAYPVAGAFGVAVSPSGEIWVLTRLLNLVKRLSATGASIGTFQACPVSSSSDGVNTLTCGVRAIATDALGRPLILLNEQLHYAEACSKQSYYTPPDPPVSGWDEIQRYDKSGNPLDALDVPNLPQSCYQGFEKNDDISGVAVDPTSGFDYVTKQGEAAIGYASNIGNWARLGRPPFPEQTSIVTGDFTGLAFDCHGNLYVTSPYGGALIRYDNLQPTVCRQTPPQTVHRIPFQKVKLSPPAHHGKKRLLVQLGCGVPCRGPLELRAAGVVIGKARVSLRAGTTKTFSVFSRVRLHKGLRVTALFNGHGLRPKRVSARLLAQSSITLLAPAHPTVGAPMTITGRVRPRPRGTLVQIAAVGPDAEVLGAHAKTDASGRFTAMLTLASAGRWVLSGAVGRTAGAQPAQVSRGVLAGPLPQPVKSSPLLPAVQLGCPTGALASQALLVTGQAPPLSLVDATITQPDGTSRSMMLASNAAGALSIPIAADQPGAWQVQASVMFGASATCTIPVSQKASEVLTLECPAGSVPLIPATGKGTASFTGDTSPPLGGQQVTVTIETKAGSRSAGATVQPDGSFTANLDVDLTDVGPGSASASYSGDASHLQASSPACKFSVGE